MGTAKIASAPPFLIFGAAVLAFGCWIACESVQVPDCAHMRPLEKPQVLRDHVLRFLRSHTAVAT